MTPVIARTREELASARAEITGTLALVPTMGALHEGHLSLIRRAGELADAVAVSIFVNPLQFGPHEDLDRYPRTFEADVAACAAEGVDLIWAPTVEEMYPAQPQVRLSAGRMGTVVEGASRPGHFDGVLTVVMKLFNQVRPDVAVFGAKDAQQLALIRRMVADLDVPVRIEAGPTVREADGLALSSRNRYLSPEERRTALALSRALRAGEQAAGEGPAAILHAARAVLAEAEQADPPLVPDYLELVDPATFEPVGESHAGEAVLVVAAKVGTTRLIDNVPLTLEPREK
ncbi:pantoate--beta-alanine ligase [Thermomonospora curvata]|uniref:Pantothenate synthetase n=1 Tax=Thermomonospora curvata (strain ATCC 19995 / DSM 43183 / JCM 3096 / KCTC 9072 / NBRC 15933 / NCIMB 10081 / Henssen B9) TaxID=471852 RepID=D1A529_THECD|nr:pantoate--beta-alanine ligase [Thermomonospora curvata]ACZ00015.1 pantoate/beta-alanine ligase [Thermomonospora curvata DSM 43183]